jgi:hypothetical protein
MCGCPNIDCIAHRIAGSVLPRKAPSRSAQSGDFCV